jgi:antirestriction protein
MTLSTIQVLEKAADLGVKLAIASPDRLTYQPIEKCPLDFVDALRRYKTRLLALLRFPFVMVYSQAVEEMLFFCEDEATNAALIEAGADEWSIYTRAELQILCEQNRVASLSPDELRKVHEIKRTFGSRIATDHGS